MFHFSKVYPEFRLGPVFPLEHAPHGVQDKPDQMEKRV